MAVSRTLRGLWNNRVETHENHKEPDMRTRYYRESKDKILDKILVLVKQKFSRWNVTYTHKERGEILIEARQGLSTSDITITVFPITPLRCAVDMTCAKRGNLGDLGAGYRNVLSFFAALDKQSTPETR